MSMKSLDDENQQDAVTPATLLLNSPILLSNWKSNKTVATSISDEGNKDDSSLVSLTGRHLSQKHELLTLFSDDPTKIHLRFNDIIYFLRDEKAMGTNNDNKIGFFRSYRGQAEQWKILPLALQWSNALIEAGKPILLQNELTGGLLSVIDDTLTVKNFHLNIDSSDDLADMVGTNYGREQVWLLDAVHTPPNPCYSSRPYMTGCHLYFPKRHDIIINQDPFENRSRRTFSAGQRPIIGGKGELSTLPVGMQERVIVEEVLGALLGLDGNYISFDVDDGIYRISEKKIDDNIAQLVDRILPTASDYVKVNAFVSSHLGGFEHGRIGHALCGAIDTLLQDYMNFITQLDDKVGSDEGLSLSALWGDVQSCVRTITILNKVVKVAAIHKGGAQLNALETLREAYLGDDNARVLFRFLLDRASTPYFDMLRGWIQDGTLKDPFSEFMVQESGNMKSQDFCYNLGDGSVDQWSSWYSLKDEHVLNLMKSGNELAGIDGSNMDLAMKIVTTGKYWNATSLCKHRDNRAAQLSSLSSKDGKGDLLSALSYGMGAAEMSRYVDREYEMSSRVLLNIFMRDYRTLDVLAFMKRYFLLDQGDFFVHFLDMAEDELLQEMSKVSRGRVQNWMAVSIQMSGGAGGEEGSPYDFEGPNDTVIDDIASNLTGAFATDSLISHLDALHSGGIDDTEPKTPSRHAYGGASKGLQGMEAFMLDFRTVPFPLSLILSRHSIANYQLMFRHLFFAKHVERRLVGTWLDHQVIKEYQSLRKDLGRTYFLRQRMLHFSQNFVYYILFEVIEPNWLSLKEQLQRKDSENEEQEYSGVECKTVDDVLRKHSEFVQKTLSECLLANRDLIRILTKLMTTCLLFTDQMKLFMETTQIQHEQNKIATESRQKRNRKMYEGLSAAREKKMTDSIKAAQEQRRLQKQRQVEKLQRELNTESYKRMITRFEQVFNSNLSEFMTQLMSDSNSHAHTHLQNLCVRLDYNGFVTRSMNIA
mmetsp:Transcript_18861/g.28678  ORF Transcript_18861/g.28678 Transcript_18861/m.28678 type:complete len:989 (+) Transcript_18861:247-3213(+)|eukprot:CAMPEP_0194119748 /NCGR_PEP_ID=MMETSP0150-20130528/40684_1 /TAXON_ID=122233 /ORGANISM="Chaetoceros debilis, Strain MM31A-1" /LENGTH=988 /DNA_ID=CAMNT_0038811563 /DNA_START=229 /DNA_END=3195 /DNA_ORIENTATION=-